MWQLRPRPKETVSLEIPKDTLESLKKVAVNRDMSLEALLKLYIGQSLRQDLAKLFSNRVLEATAQVLARHIQSEEEISTIIQENSVDDIIASGPQAEFLEQAARILKPGERIYINANFSNRYRFGTTTGKKPPDDETLSRLGLQLVRDEGSLDSRFSSLVFRRTDGTEIPRVTVKAVIFERIE